MLQGVLSLLLSNLVSNSIVPIGTKITAAVTGPLLFAFYRFFVGTLLLCIIYIFTQKKKITKSEYKDLTLLGLFLTTTVVLFTVGIAYTTVIMSALIYSITPILVGVGGHVYLREPLDRRKVAGLIVSAAGLLFLLSQSNVGFQRNTYGQPFGNILICAAMVIYSLFVIHSRKILHAKDTSPVQITLMMFAVTALLLFIVLCISLIFGGMPLIHLSGTDILGFVLVGCGSVVQYLFLLIGVKKTNAFTASLFQYTGPFIAASITIPLLHEQVSFPLVSGGALVLAGVFIATTYKIFNWNVSE